jgi:hypothetical protein
VNSCQLYGSWKMPDDDWSHEETDDPLYADRAQLVVGWHACVASMFPPAIAGGTLRESSASHHTGHRNCRHAVVVIVAAHSASGNGGVYPRIRSLSPTDASNLAMAHGAATGQPRMADAAVVACASLAANIFSITMRQAFASASTLRLKIIDATCLLADTDFQRFLRRGRFGARSNIGVTHDVTAKLEDLGTFKRQIGLTSGSDEGWRCSCCRGRRNRWCCSSSA